MYGDYNLLDAWPASLNRLPLLSDINFLNNRMVGPHPDVTGRRASLARLTLLGHCLQCHSQAPCAGLPSLVSVAHGMNLFDGPVPDFGRFPRTLRCYDATLAGKFTGNVCALIGLC